MIELLHGDCLDLMKNIPDKSIDMILCDLPYGITECKWDSIIPFGEMWQQLDRIIKENGAVVLFGSEPFSSALRMSNIKNYKYDWVWVKSQSRGFLNAWKQPMRNIETMSVFYKKQCNYFPILTDKPIENIRPLSGRSKSNNYGSFKHGKNERKCPIDKSMPHQVIKFNNQQTYFHPTQKPVDLMEYLIKTYTNKNETVLDFTMGSGTTGVACINTNRNFIGIEKEGKYFDIAKDRITKAQQDVVQKD